MSEPEPLARPPKLRIAVAALFLVFSCATLIGSVVPARDGLQRTQHRLDKQRAENRRLEQLRTELVAEERALLEKPWLTRRMLRGYGITDPDEIIVR